MNEYACGIVINGHHTDIAIKSYSDRILLIVTQFKKFGTLLTVDRERTANGRDMSYSIKVLFGSDNTDVAVAARYIAEQINIKESIVLSIALKDYNVTTLKAIVAAVNRIKPW